MTIRREIARKRVPREAYLVSRMRQYRHTHSVMRFTFHERRFTRKRSGSAIATETFVNNAGYAIPTGKKLKHLAAEGQNGFIHSLNGNELVADADHHNPSTQHRCFKPAEDPPILTSGVRAHHVI